MWAADLYQKARIILATCAILAMLGQPCPIPVGQTGSRGWLVTDEPSAASAFIASQRDHDPSAAERATSPLYRAEMQRRGRGEEWPFSGLWTEATSQLDFRFVGAIADGMGFTYALYAARSKPPVGPDSPTSLWRIDLAPEGRVIWGELARIFTSPDVEIVYAPPDGAASSTVALPWAVSDGGDQPRSAFGMRSAAGDAYLALGLGWRQMGDDRPARVAFVMLDARGNVLPDCWSFGQPIPSWDPEWHPVDPRTFDLGELDSADAATLEAYLASLAEGELYG